MQLYSSNQLVKSESFWDERTNILFGRKRSKQLEENQNLDISIDKNSNSFFPSKDPFNLRPLLGRLHGYDFLYSKYSLRSEGNEFDFSTKNVFFIDQKTLNESLTLGFMKVKELNEFEKELGK